MKQTLPPLVRGSLLLLLLAFATAACTASVGNGIPSPGGNGTGANGGTGALSGGTGSTPGSQGGSGAGLAPGGQGGAAVSACGSAILPGRAPLRRLTRFEYNNTVATLLGDTTQPGDSLPTEVIGNGFGNDADTLSASTVLVEQFGTVAEGIAQRATATPAALTKLAACAGGITATSTAAAEDACARTFITTFIPRSYRRPITTTETDEFFTLYKAIRTGRTFVSGMAAVIEAALQAPEFLYRVEVGAPDKTVPALKRPTGPEMATRLSYLFWGTSPDDTLTTAAASGALLTGDGVLLQATRLLNDPRSHAVIRFFFDNVLPIKSLSDIPRDKALFPNFSNAIGAAMYEETQQFLEYEIFQGGGTWPSALTAPYTFVNDALAAYYGISGVTGTNFRKVNLPNTSQRLGLILQGGMMTGTIVSNKSNPVLRGSFIVKKLMCRNINLPTDPAVLAMVMIPADTSGATARERFSKHSAQPICAGCHQFLDPLGFALENYDPVGMWRPQENGVTIDASGSVPGTVGTVNGPVELVQKLAGSEEVQNCFASRWMDFGYGRTLDTADQCARTTVNEAFKKSGYNVKQLLLALTQTNSFLYLP